MSIHPNAAEFLAEFVRVENRLRDLAEDEEKSNFSQLLRRAIGRGHKSVRRWQPELQQFADLRNLLAHTAMGQDPIAVPSSTSCKRLRQIADSLTSPPKIHPAFGGEVATFEGSEPIGAVAKVAFEKGYSQFPITSENRVVALLTAATVFRWLGALVAEDIFSVSECTVGQVLEHEEQSEAYKIVTRDTDVFEVLELFEEALQGGRPIGAILINQDGRPASKLLGIVSPWDFPRIYAQAGLR